MQTRESIIDESTNLYQETLPSDNDDSILFVPNNAESQEKENVEPPLK